MEAQDGAASMWSSQRCPSISAHTVTWWRMSWTRFVRFCTAEWWHRRGHSCTSSKLASKPSAGQTHTLTMTEHLTIIINHIICAECVLCLCAALRTVTAVSVWMIWRKAGVGLSKSCCAIILTRGETWTWANTIRRKRKMRRKSSTNARCDSFTVSFMRWTLFPVSESCCCILLSDEGLGGSDLCRHQRFPVQSQRWEVLRSSRGQNLPWHRFVSYDFLLKLL